MPNLSRSRIGQIAIVCQDVGRASTFYRDSLGLRHLFDAGPNLSFFECGGVRLMLTTVERPEDDHPGSTLFFFVDDIHAIHRDLTAQGVRFIDAPHLIARMPDHELWVSAFVDTEGNTMAIMEEKR